MKTVYLDQLHWIEISKEIHGLAVRDGTAETLEHMRCRVSEGELLFPLSLAHYLETLKNADPGRRQRLSNVMRELSGGYTIADCTTVLKHEIRSALIRKLEIDFPLAPLKFLGRGMEHALGRSFNLCLEWPYPDKVPEQVRKKVELDVFDYLEATLLSGVLDVGEGPVLFPKMGLEPDKEFQDRLTEWRGSGTNKSVTELRREVCAITLADIKEPLFVVLTELGITMAQVGALGEAVWCDLLEMMPSRRADMHLLTQWAKNASLNPRESDLIDWAYLGIAVCYCDLVVTEKQMNDLFQRSTEFKSKSTARLADLLEL